MRIDDNYKEKYSLKIINGLLFALFNYYLSIYYKLCFIKEHDLFKEMIVNEVMDNNQLLLE